MSLKWYIINTQTGCENTAKLSIEKRIEKEKLDEQFGEILIPSENVVQLVKGKRTQRVRKFFPGYIFVQMILSDSTWHLVKGSAKVSGFVGTKGRPSAVSAEEVSKVTQQIKTGAQEKPRMTFSVGESVIVVDGPFSSFNGSVEEINEEKLKVKVLVSIFGRPTPVEFDFAQVEKA